MPGPDTDRSGYARARRPDDPLGVLRRRGARGGVPAQRPRDAHQGLVRLPAAAYSTRYDVVLYDYLGQGESSSARRAVLDPASSPATSTLILDDLGIGAGPRDGDLLRRLRRARVRAAVPGAAAHADALGHPALPRGAVRDVPGRSRCASTAAARRRSSSTPTTCTRRSSARRSCAAITREQLEAMRQRFHDRYRTDPLPHPPHRGAGPVLRRARRQPARATARSRRRP